MKIIYTHNDIDIEAIVLFELSLMHIYVGLKWELNFYYYYTKTAVHWVHFGMTSKKKNQEGSR